MNKLRKTILPMIGLSLLTACGLWQPKPPVGDDQWLTPDEAYEDQTAHTGMDGGAFVTMGLKIRDPDSLAARIRLGNTEACFYLFLRAYYSASEDRTRIYMINGLVW